LEAVIATAAMDEASRNAWCREQGLYPAELEAAHLAKRTALAEVHAMSARPVLHGDNGASLKGITVLAMLHWLGIAPSHST
jgi:hypothetical protein